MCLLHVRLCVSTAGWPEFGCVRARLLEGGWGVGGSQSRPGRWCRCWHRNFTGMVWWIQSLSFAFEIVGHDETSVRIRLQISRCVTFFVSLEFSLAWRPKTWWWWCGKASVARVTYTKEKSDLKESKCLMTHWIMMTTEFRSGQNHQRKRLPRSRRGMAGEESVVSCWCRRWYRLPAGNWLLLLS